MAEYVDRDAVLKEYEEWVEATGVLKKGSLSYYECMSCITSVPAADVVEAKQFKWIRVEDRLPPEDTRVLVHIVTKRVHPENTIKLDTDRMLKGKWVRWGTDITHWMPLPEPPEKRG